MIPNWLDSLQEIIKEKPIVILSLAKEEFEILASKGHVAIVHRRLLLAKIKAPYMCLLLGENWRSSGIFLAYIRSRVAIATLDSRLAIGCASKIKPTSIDFLSLLLDIPRNGQAGNNTVMWLDSKSSGILLDDLYSLPENHQHLKAIEGRLRKPVFDTSPRGLQKDALKIVLELFDIKYDDAIASSIDIDGKKDSELSKFPRLLEDNVIGHDARIAPGYNMTGGDYTGRAVFEKGDQRLEIITANRTRLEQALGVDLIYHNTTNANIVMLQYKMLEEYEHDKTKDWIYKLNGSLLKQIERMRSCQMEETPLPYEFRLNADVFYLKFVKRSGSPSDTGIIVPLEHFERFINRPESRGNRSGYRLSARSLGSRYLSQRTFLDLVQAGYIGSHSNTTRNLEALIRLGLENGRAIVAAIQSKIDNNAKKR